MVLSEAIRFVSSELGNGSEVASLSDLTKSRLGPGRAMTHRPFVASLHGFPWGHGADVELPLERTSAARSPFSFVS
jgi:hypothetical protein